MLWVAGNYFIDPTYYFTIRREPSNHIYQSYHTRMAKAYYLRDYGDEYDGIIIGGSKSGMMRPALFEKYTGGHYYHFYADSATYLDALCELEFIVNNTNIRRVVFCPSSYDVCSLDTGEKIPAVLAGSSERFEIIKQLCTNISSWYTWVRSKDEPLFCLPDGTWDTSIDFGKYCEDTDGYVVERVTNDFQENIDLLFSDDYEPKLEASEYNIDTLRQMKKLCDENDIEFTVIITPTYIESLYMFESEAYYDYLRELVEVTDVWDFSGFNAICQNPYNCRDDTHFFLPVGEAIAAVVYGDEKIEDFGIYLTKDNIDDYLESRRADYETLKKEWEETGTVTLYGADDDSNFMKR